MPTGDLWWLEPTGMYFIDYEFLIRASDSRFPDQVDGRPFWLSSEQGQRAEGPDAKIDLSYYF